MLVKLNAFRDGARPGDIVDVPDADGAVLIHHGAAFPADGTEPQAAKAKGGSRTVRAAAALQAASGAETAEAPTP